MKAKAKGTLAEHRVMRYLEANGYCTTRAAASLGMWDIVAVPKRDDIGDLTLHWPVLVQVKCNDMTSKKGRGVIDELLKAARETVGHHQLWVQFDGSPGRYGTKPYWHIWSLDEWDPKNYKRVTIPEEVR